VIFLIGITGAIVCGLFSVTGSRPSTYWLCLLAVLFGLTGLSWNGVFLTSVGEFSHVALAGTATGLSFVIINLGAIAGPPLFGYVVDITDGYRLPWLLTAFCMSLVVVLTAMQTKERMVRNQL
jgi:MFS family permease